MVLWALATVSTVQEAWTLRQLRQLSAQLSAPVDGVVASLRAERAAAAVLLARPGAGEQAELDRRKAGTESALRALRTGVALTSADIASLAPGVNERLGAIEQALSRLRAAEGTRDWQTAFTGYSDAIQEVFSLDAALANVQSGLPENAVLPLARLGEMLARQDAVMASAQAAGELTADQRRAFGDAVGGQRLLAGELSTGFDQAALPGYERLLSDDSYRSLTALQNEVLTDPGGRPVTSTVFAGQWGAAMETVNQDLGAVRASASASASAAAEQAGDSALTRGAVTVTLGLLAVVLALVISVRIGREHVLELVGLRDSALELARNRLPKAMRRLRAGEKIDVDDVPVVPPGDGEIGEVGSALNAVQGAALRAAAERAELLTGVSGVFVTLARRSQSLVHRQLSLLDTMERRIEDPADLEDLFRLDHLAARMRRHAEGLIIMSGATPGRVWSEPVPLMTVLRAAVAEVEEFQRVEVRRMADVAVQGSAVADLTHMVAELVENATSFSPPNTTVLVNGEPVGAGFVVEIEDRGLGMRPESMAEANRRISEAHQLDLFDSDQLGFFVISRLANRQGITVTLRRSAYGGTTAVLLLPSSILTTIAEPKALVRSGAATRQPAAVAAAPEPERAPAAPDPDRPPPDPPRQARQLAPGSDGPPPTADGETGGLPRRRRQASLAPGLRTATERSPGPAPAPQGSPEQARATMSALQRGFIRGRNE
ncbi:hypothetical protein BA062_09705 [Prauserella flavalba]|uniref:histidine kinase n=2 Tax=Prauserella flavalba TaxID=1477506 RepID=A0A318LQT3_9PSEU|nr:hypothetical protein BA062_09705 [Prauserella flavalba]